MSTILISGASRGLGRETTRRLAERGHTVYAGARDPARTPNLGVRWIALDVTDDASVAAAAETVRSEAGHLDVLVNNAGIAGEQRIPAEASLDDMRTVFETNVFGVTRMLAAFTLLLELSENPVVVNVSSASGSLTRNADPNSHWSSLAYPMSKAALNMLTLQYAKAFPRWRVNAVTPGLTDTEFSNVPGGRPVEEAAKIIIWAAQLGPDGPTGLFTDDSGPIPW